LKREPPAALRRILRSTDSPRDFLRAAVNGIVQRLGVSDRDVATELSGSESAEVSVKDLRAPEAVAIPLGVVEAVIAGHVRVGGDLLVSSAALSRVEQLAQAAWENRLPLDERVLAPLQGAPLDGARPADVLDVLRRAFESTQR
jgi:hypothetical protein